MGSAHYKPDQQEMVEQTLANGFASLRFPKQLEKTYRGYRHSRLVPRSITVGWYALAIHLAYCFSDYVLLPESVHFQTIAIRVFIILPFVGFVVWASKFNWRPSYYVNWYLSAYLVCGLAVIAIIQVGRVEGVPIPYEGLLLVMMFGYFVTGLPFYSMVFASMVMFVAYVLSEIAVGYPVDVLTYNAFFILTANVIGAVGNYIQEHTQRTNFLNQTLVEISRDQAVDTSESKTMLLATASHDLRQPLHAMNLFVENLLAKLPDGEPRTTADKLGQSIQHLNRLLSSLLDYSRLDAGVVKPQISKVELYDMLTQIKADLEEHPDSPTVEIKNEGVSPCFVESDGILLARVLRNICNNVVEHANATQMSIQILPLGETINLEISDNGKGMSHKEQREMFKEFYQGDTENNAGMGLGLAIVKQSVDLLGIPLKVYSEKGRGTTFSLQLRRAAVIEQIQDVEVESDDFSGKRVLVVEDLPEILESSVALFRSWGCITFGAASVDEAVKISMENELDLVVSDFHLGKDETGLDLVKEMRLIRGSSLPAIIVTADINVQLEGDDRTFVSHKPVRPSKYRVMFAQLLSS